MFEERELDDDTLACVLHIKLHHYAEETPKQILLR